MQLPAPLVKALLSVLFVVSVAIGVADSNYDLYPYFKGESATEYHHMAQIAQTGSLPAVDDRLLWPDGYRPAPSRPPGVAYLTGFSYRLVALITDRSPRVFCAWMVIAFASLAVFFMYGIARRLWQCQAAGLIAAFMTAVSAPLVAASNGREFVVEPFALVGLSAHLWCLIALWRAVAAHAAENGPGGEAEGEAPALPGVGHWLAGIGVTAILLLLLWNAAPVCIAVAAVACLTVFDDRTNRVLLPVYAVVMLVASLSVAYLRSNHMLVAWPTILVAVSATIPYLRASLPPRIPPLAYVGMGFLPLVFFLQPFQARDGEALPVASYVWQRLLNLAGRPDNPVALDDAVRIVWDRAHAPPPGHVMLDLWLPVLVLLPFAWYAVSRMPPWARRPWKAAALMGTVGAVCFAIDRNALPLAVVGMFPVVAAVGFGFGRAWRTRALPLAIAAYLLAAPALWPAGGPNLNHHLARAAGMSPGLPDGFSWVSLGNADKELLRYLVTRTATRDVVLAPGHTATFTAAFAGRRSVLVSGDHRRSVVAREAEILESFYRDERELYALCDSLEVSYVVYSIDLLLDTSTYSPRYAAGYTAVPEHAVARRMHFSPAGLRHFTLIYENDNYRLFRVTDTPTPMFLTDHPVVYQQSVMERHGDTLESFYRRVVDILTTYSTAVLAQVHGDDRAALGRFRYCLDQAPRFTRAWLGVGDSLVRMRNWSNANAAYRRVLEYAPDNDHALYYAALTYGHMEQMDEALKTLEILFATGGERELLAMATQLKATLEAGIPLGPPEERRDFTPADTTDASRGPGGSNAPRTR